MIHKSFVYHALALLALFFALPAQAAFTDNGDGTVTDTVTGLMWDKCSWGQSDNATCAGGAATQVNWNHALLVAVTANGANYKSHNDWRLPNKNELESLVKIDAANPAIDAAAFPNTVSDCYQTSTRYAPGLSHNWCINFAAGGVGFAIDTFYVRLVRGGQSLDSFDAQGDSIPDGFSFTAQTGAALSTVATSNTITVAGINTASPISITGGSYSINGGAYTAVSGAVNNGDTVTVQQTSSGSFSTLTTATLTIGGVDGAFDVTTLPRDTIPDAFSFTAQTGVALSSVATSNSITVTGINSAASISITGGTYSINGGGYTAVTGTVNNGDTVTVQQTSSASYSTLTTATLTIGGNSGLANVSGRKHILALAGVSAAFDVTTVAAPVVNGVCGTANGVATAFVPSAGLCTAGTAGAVTGGTAWTWGCTGSGGGTSANCSAPYQTVPTSGGTGHATTSGGTWAVDPAQSAGFIPTTGHAKSPPGLPPGVSFPYGLFDFTLITGAAGSTATITITYPVAPPAGAVYWKYGPSPAGYNCTGAGCAVAHWYQMPPAQAVFAGNSVTLTITDGGVGDDDLTANSIIVDQGGPGVPAVAGIPTLSEWGLILLSGLLALFGAGVVRRRMLPVG